ncbi:MAG: hypothetical protein U0S36_09505 [Candidatus Nanopelagicales bacterium]
MGGVGVAGALFAVVMVVLLVALILVLAPMVRRRPVEEPVEEAPALAPRVELPPDTLTVEERLAEIDALHADGRISDAERDEARVRIITGT